VRYHTQTKIGETRVLYWDLKAWVPFYQNPNNPNLDQFRGIWEVNLTLTRFLNPYFNIGDVSLRVYPGGRYFTNPVFGGQELTVRVRAGQTILPSFVGQIFHGYGENLLDYNVNRWGFRAGIGF
jgi:outer membrane phospholipase A